MCIVHDGGYALLRPNGFEASVHGLHGTHLHQGLLRFDTEHDLGCIDGEQVAGIEPAHELYAYLPAVHFKNHALETLFHDAALEVCCRLHGVSLCRSLAVLHHYHAVLVVGIHNGEGILG